MFLQSRKASLLLLGVTSLVCSRALFALFDDPEGPNLLIVVVMAAVMYVLSLTVYISSSPATDSKKFRLAILIQLALVAVLYFFLR